MFSKISSLLPLHGLLCLLHGSASQNVGDVICVEGYIMDYFCIERGNLLDLPDVMTLENPEMHSFHCLLDPPSCISSSFEVLVPNPNGGTPAYSRGFRLDDATKALAVEVAKSIGDSACQSCDGTGDKHDGFLVNLQATVVTAATESTPATISASEVIPIMGDTASLCQDSDKMLRVGDSLCAEGYVMDYFCIERGNFVDLPDVMTLENPEMHTFHCLLDPPSCAESYFEVLVPNPSGSPAFSRGFRLDNETKARVVELAKQVGDSDCVTCDGTGDKHAGFNVLFDAATVVALPTDSVPITISAMNVTLLEDGASQCPKSPGAFVPPALTETGSSFGSIAYAHGALMLVAWGWLLPQGIVLAVSLKHRPNGLWFKLHQAFQLLGTCCALAGFIIALIKFTALNDKGFTNYKHAVMGVTTMALGLLQPVNALFRPDRPEEGQMKELKRFLWEIFHKGTGYSSILLSIPTISLGTTLLPQPQQGYFQKAYGIGLGATLLLMFLLISYDKYNYSKYAPVSSKEFSSTTEGDDEKLQKMGKMEEEPSVVAMGD